MEIPLFLFTKKKCKIKKKKGGCANDPLFDLGFGGCETYAPGEMNALLCVNHDGACDACGCSCHVECAGKRFNNKKTNPVGYGWLWWAIVGYGWP